MMHTMMFLSFLLFTLLAAPSKSVPAGTAAQPIKPDRDLQWFQATEQSLMDAIAPGDKKIWDRLMDPSCVVTTEEGQLLSKEQFLNELTGLPKGLSGSIKVQDLTIQRLGDFAIVRFRLEEQEDVFGQQLSTQYRVTDTFRRAGAEWKVVASHFSVVTADPPAQAVSKADWAALAGTYKLLPDGWTFHVVLQDGVLSGGRDPAKLRPFIPLAPNVFTLQGSLGEWIFVKEHAAKAGKIVHFRKFEPLIWTRVE